MNHIYYTAVPLDSNFILESQRIRPVNFQLNTTITECYYPIIPVIEATAKAGDTVKVIAVRQTNSIESENFRKLQAELSSLKLKHLSLHDCTIPESQNQDMLLVLFEKLMDFAEPDACYHACMTFGTKSYPLVLFGVLSYVEKIVPNTEICGIYYREIKRSRGKTVQSSLYDMTTLFSLNKIVDTVAEMDCTNKEQMIRLMLHAGE